MRTVTPPCYPPPWSPCPSPTRKACDRWIRLLHRAGCPRSRRRREKGERGKGRSGSTSPNTSLAGAFATQTCFKMFKVSGSRHVKHIKIHTPHPAAIYMFKRFL